MGTWGVTSWGKGDSGMEVELKEPAVQTPRGCVSAGGRTDGRAARGTSQGSGSSVLGGLRNLEEASGPGTA